MNPAALLLAAALALAADPQAEANPVYRDLLKDGVAVDAKTKLPLPAPAVPDGLEAAAQKKALVEVVASKYALEDFVRDTSVAPIVLTVRDLPGGNPQAPAKAVDAWFVVFGDLDTLTRQKFRQRLLTLGQDQVKHQQVPAAALDKRGIKTAPFALDQEEFFGHVEGKLFDKVQVEETHHVFVTRANDSLVVASVLDPRFAGDAEFPNQWRPLKNGVAGDPQPYEGVGRYLKVTRLAEPKGALLVEYHGVFTEPKAWFNGANLIRSKLPMLVQTEVRSLRKELDKERKQKP
jgi:hypothetical protein